MLNSKEAILNRIFFFHVSNFLYTGYLAISYPSINFLYLELCWCNKYYIILLNDHKIDHYRIIYWF